MNVIYTVTALAYAPHDTRCWGWFPTREEAEAAIRADNNDLIFENGSFDWAVIEEIPPGIMGGLDDMKTWWFKAEHRSDDTYEIKAFEGTPPEWEGVCGLAMG
jgi:hypothetical protein